MKMHGRKFIHSSGLSLFGFALWAGLSGNAIGAPSVWTGPLMTFSESTTDASNPVNQDRITANVWITRAQVAGLFNAKTEGGFTHFVSPADTEWANGLLSNYTNLSYTDWNDWAKGVNSTP